MAELTREEFLKQREDAAKRMRELYGERGTPNFPDFVALPRQPSTSPPPEEEKGYEHREKSEKVQQKFGQNYPYQERNGSPLGLLSALNLKSLTQNSETLLILGLILLLMSDNADEKLILALVFIML